MMLADDLSSLGAALREAFPVLPAVTPVRVLGAGFRSLRRGSILHHTHHAASC